MNDRFIKWLEQKYARDPAVGTIKAVRGKVHDYLAMTLDYPVKGQVKVDMTDYVKLIIKDFNNIEDLSKGWKTQQLWSKKLFHVNPSSLQLDNERAKQFHTMVAKGQLVTKRARQDIQPVIVFLCT